MPMKMKSTLSPARGGGFCAGGRVSGRTAATGGVPAAKIFMQNVEESVVALLQLHPLAASKRT